MDMSTCRCIFFTIIKNKFYNGRSHTRLSYLEHAQKMAPSPLYSVGIYKSMKAQYTPINEKNCPWGP